MMFSTSLVLGVWSCVREFELALHAVCNGQYASTSGCEFSRYKQTFEKQVGLTTEQVKGSCWWRGLPQSLPMPDWQHPDWARQRSSQKKELEL